MVLSCWAVEVKGYRAACVEGVPLTPGSPVFGLSHVQVVVAYKDAILEKWMVPTGGKI